MAPTDRKRQILDTAAELLESKSFAAFSYQDLATRLDIRKASIHHHFATKDELGRALIQYYQENANQAMAPVLDQPTPGQGLAMMLDISEEVLLHSTAKVCPTGAFEIDAAALSPETRDALHECKTTFLGQVAELLAGAREAGEAAFLGDPADQAALIGAALQGAREATPLLGIEFFRSVVRQLKRSLGL